MISDPDRHKAAELIEAANQAGSRTSTACRETGISVRTYQRWHEDGLIKSDGRPTAKRPEPINTLSTEERERVLGLCHEPENASLPPSQIVPRLADRGDYVASESSFYRILREADEQNHRGRSSQPRKAVPRASYCAEGPCQVWTWDITWLRGPVQGLFFYLYMIVDIYSREIVGWEVYERESSENAAQLVHKAVLAEGCITQPLVLHSDNGSPQKGSTLRAKLEKLGIVASYSRPRVSNDNPYSESLFRTCKYRPDYPHKGFASIEAAREWVLHFVHWYNNEHRHSGIRYVTPAERHSGNDTQILEKRKAVYEAARQKHPERWTGSTRNWSPITTVWLNPENDRESKGSTSDRLSDAA